MPLRAKGESFSACNAFLLVLHKRVQGHRSSYWFTFRQALAIEAAVANGEKASPALVY